MSIQRFLGLLLLMCGSCAAQSPPFTMLNAMTGDAGQVAQTELGQGLLTGVDFMPILTTGESQFLTGNTPYPAFAYFAIPVANVVSCYQVPSDPNAATLLTSYTNRLGSNVWDLGMPEYDQGGGCWATGRPSFSQLTDPQSYSTFTNYYLNTLQLGNYLNQTAQQRGYQWMAVADFAFSTQYGYDMGVNTMLLERNEDEMDGITPGLAFLRGAAIQHGGMQWGIDISTWRYWSNGPTVYSNGNLVTGWSTATFKRDMYIAYMGGANILHNEPAEYSLGAASGQTLNPLGLTVQNFYNFAITRHPNRGTPFVPMALMQDHYSGFNPKYGAWMQGPYKWYWANPYTPGDTMLANLLGLIYPNYNTWGTLPPGSPLVLNSDGTINTSATVTAYDQALANGSDPRPWEPFGNSTWGETFDVITNQASLAAMQHYKVIMLTTGVPVSDALLSTLTQYVSAGGILVLNAKQMSANSETLAGVHLTGTEASASSEIWAPDGSTVSESSYNYAVATLTSGSLLASTSSGNPIVTKNVYGNGTVYVTMPDFLANGSDTAILSVGQKLINMLQAQFAVVTVSGPQLEYLVNTDGASIIVTLVNTDLSGGTWSGTLSFKQPASSYSVAEWTGDSTVGSTLQNGQVLVSATVPPFDVRVYVLDPINGTAPNPPNPPTNLTAITTGSTSTGSASTGSTSTGSASTGSTSTGSTSTGSTSTGSTSTGSTSTGSAAPIGGVTYYLAPAANGGSDSNSGLTSATPWLTPNHSVNCGDVIIAAASASYSDANFTTGNWGTVNCPTANNVSWLKCATFDACKITATSTGGIWVDKSYWGVQGWEVTIPTTSSNPWAGCFWAYPSHSATAIIHHIVFANNVANGCGGGGFQASPVNGYSVDYWAVVGNIAYNSAQNGQYECSSAINNNYFQNYDTQPGTHVFIAGNFAWDTFDPNPCNGGTPTDGEGIDIANNNTYSYTGQTVVENNLTFWNGRSGVLVGDDPTGLTYVLYNTSYASNLDTNQNYQGCAEIAGVQNSNTFVYSNLVSTSQVNGCGANPIYVLSEQNGDGTDEFYSNWGYAQNGQYTLVYESGSFAFGPNNTFQDPQFTNAPNSNPGAPNCSSYSSVPACMAPIIADFVPRASGASAYGYQTPLSYPVADPLFPQWLCNVNLPSGLVTMGCSSQ